jgi:hypothetical protein
MPNGLAYSNSTSPNAAINSWLAGKMVETSTAKHDGVAIHGYSINSAEYLVMTPSQPLR